MQTCKIDDKRDKIELEIEISIMKGQNTNLSVK